MAALFCLLATFDIAAAVATSVLSIDLHLAAVPVLTEADPVSPAVLSSLEAREQRLALFQ